MDADAEWTTVEQAAAALGLTVSTLRRWCRGQDSAPFARQIGRTWEVNMGTLQRYLAVRRRAGASRITFAGLNFLGEFPNPRPPRDAAGWRFVIGKPDGEQVLFKIWIGSELIARLRVDGVDVFDLMLRAAERLAEDKMLRPDRAWLERSEIELGIRDRVRLLTAAGRAPDFLLPGEAPMEEGVPVMYELTTRDSAWVGEHMTTSKDAEFGDVVVDWIAKSGRRLVSTVRLRKPIVGSKSDVVRRALIAYRDRCRRLGQLPSVWANDVELRVSGDPATWRSSLMSGPSEFRRQAARTPRVPR
jgi:hypothetical protein